MSWFMRTLRNHDMMNMSDIVAVNKIDTRSSVHILIYAQHGNFAQDQNTGYTSIAELFEKSSCYHAVS